MVKKIGGGGGSNDHVVDEVARVRDMKVREGGEKRE